MIKRICSVWLVGAIVVSAGSVVTSQSAFGEGPMATIAAVLAPAPILAQDPEECDACVPNEDEQGEFWQCCDGCADLYPERESGTDCTTPTRDKCDFEDDCEPTLAFNTLRGDGTMTVMAVEADGEALATSLSLAVARAASAIEEGELLQVLVACDGSVLGRTYDADRMVALREASSRVIQ